MAYLVAGGPGSTAVNPVLDLYTFVNGVPQDAFAVRIQIFDISTEANKLEYFGGNKSAVQVFPTNPGDFFSLDVEHLTTDIAQPGHKLSVGHYFAPFDATPDTLNLGDYIIEWRYTQTDGAPEKVYCEEFVLIKSGDILTGLNCMQKLKLFVQDEISKNELLEQLEYSQQQYALALELSVQRLNVIPPYSSWTLSNYPKYFEYLVCHLGGVGHLLRSTSIEQLRNQLTYTDGNIHVGLKDKHQFYLNAGNLFLADFDKMGQQVKIQVNNDSAWGDVNSPYASLGSGYWGGWGSV